MIKMFSDNNQQMREKGKNYYAILLLPKYCAMKRKKKLQNYVCLIEK